jgi:hypothetical protein
VRLDLLDSRASVWVALWWRAVQVFVATLLVDLAAGKFVMPLRNVEFWQDCVAAGASALVSGLLALAAHAGRQHVP